MNGQDSPVSAGETYDVEIKSIGGKGDGIARVGGFVLFVPNVKKGDYVKIKVTKVLQNAGFAEVVKQLEKLDKPERPRRSSRFTTITKEELEKEQEPETQYDDTEDFGEDLDEEEWFT